MARIGWIGQLWLGVAAVSFSSGIVMPAAGAPTVKGDSAAWAEIVASLKKSETVSYRAKYTAGGVTMIAEFVPPNSRHTIAQTPAGVSETISVGNAYRVRTGDKWVCPPAETAPGLQQPIWDHQGEVTVARGQDLVIDGMPTHGYAYTYTDNSQGHPLTTNQKLYVAVLTGLPRRAVVDRSGSTMTPDFYDYGASITITLPPCT